MGSGRRSTQSARVPLGRSELKIEGLRAAARCAPTPQAGLRRRTPRAACRREALLQAHHVGGRVADLLLGLVDGRKPGHHAGEGLVGLAEAFVEALIHMAGDRLEAPAPVRFIASMLVPSCSDGRQGRSEAIPGRRGHGRRGLEVSASISLRQLFLAGGRGVGKIRQAQDGLLLLASQAGLRARDEAAAKPGVRRPARRRADHAGYPPRRPPDR